MTQNKKFNSAGVFVRLESMESGIFKKDRVFLDNINNRERVIGSLADRNGFSFSKQIQKQDMELGLSIGNIR